MKKLCLGLSLSLLFLVFFSCSDKEKEAEDFGNETSPKSALVKNADTPSITGLWKLLYMGNQYIDATYRMQFSNDETYYGVTKCFNMNNGTYTISERPSEVHDMISATIKLGMKRYRVFPTELEDLFVYAYDHISGFKVGDDGLLHQLKGYGSNTTCIVKWERISSVSNELNDIRGTWKVKSVGGTTVTWPATLNIPALNAEARMKGRLEPNIFAGIVNIYDSEVHVSTGINNLTINPLNFIGNICDDEEARYLQILEQVDGYMINGPILTLYAQEDVIATFGSVSTQAAIQEFNSAVMNVQK